MIVKERILNQKTAKYYGVSFETAQALDTFLNGLNTNEANRIIQLLNDGVVKQKEDFFGINK